MLQLEEVRGELARLEHHITLHLADRQFYPLNKPIYEVRGVPGYEPTFLDALLYSIECAQSPFGRFDDYRELPFFDNLPPSRKKRDHPVSPLHPGLININSEIKGKYTEFLESFLPPRADNNTYGAAATCDILILQHLARRINLGRDVAEAKFIVEENSYTPLIRAENREGIMGMLTDEGQEQRVLGSVRAKGSLYGVPPDMMESLYRNLVIPLTKEIEVLYLLRRLSPSRTINRAQS